MFELPPVPGTTRYVYMAKTFVVKLPRYSFWWNKFPRPRILLNNMAINRVEAKLMREHKGKPGIPELIWSDWFGFINVVKRYKPIPSLDEYVRLYNDLVDKTELDPELWEWDNPMHNFGLTEDGKIVKIDL